MTALGGEGRQSRLGERVWQDSCFFCDSSGPLFSLLSTLSFYWAQVTVLADGLGPSIYQVTSIYTAEDGREKMQAYKAGTGFPFREGS